MLLPLRTYCYEIVNGKGKDESLCYFLAGFCATNRRQIDNQMSPQLSVGKVRKEKLKQVNSRKEESS